MLWKTKREDRLLRRPVPAGVQGLKSSSEMENQHGCSDEKSDGKERDRNKVRATKGKSGVWLTISGVAEPLRLPRGRRLVCKRKGENDPGAAAT